MFLLDYINYIITEKQNANKCSLNIVSIQDTVYVFA